MMYFDPKYDDEQINIEIYGYEAATLSELGHNIKSLAKHLDVSIDEAIKIWELREKLFRGEMEDGQDSLNYSKINKLIGLLEEYHETVSRIANQLSKIAVIMENTNDRQATK